MRAPKDLKIPTINAELDTWAYNFGTLLGFAGASFATYGLAAAPTNLGTLINAFHNARIANLKPNQSIALTGALAIAKDNLLNYVRPLAQAISNAPETTVSRALKIGIRVNPKFTSKAVAGANVVPRTKILVTDSAPVISALPSDNLTLKCQYHFSGANLRTGSSKKRSSAKPVGAESVQWFYKVTAPVPGRDPYEGMVPMVTATRSPFTFTFSPALAGRTAFMAARFVSQRGQYGAWSGVISSTIPVEGVNPGFGVAPS